MEIIPTPTDHGQLNFVPACVSQAKRISGIDHQTDISRFWDLSLDSLGCQGDFEGIPWGKTTSSSGIPTFPGPNWGQTLYETKAGKIPTVLVVPQRDLNHLMR